MNPPEDRNLRLARRLLTEIAETASESDLTGAFRSGVASAVTSYNGVLRMLGDRLPPGLFEPLDPSATEFGAVGVQCRLLAAALEEDLPPQENIGSLVALAPFLESADLGNLVRETFGDGPVPAQLLPALAPFLDSEQLGDLVRRRAPAPPNPPAPPSPPDLRLSAREEENLPH